MQEDSKKNAVITVVGNDQIGLIAKVSGLLAEVEININDISQTIMGEYFTMIMLVDLERMSIDIRTLSDRLEILGHQLGLSIRVQHADIFDAMHRI